MSGRCAAKPAANARDGSWRPSAQPRGISRPLLPLIVTTGAVTPRDIRSVSPACLTVIGLESVWNQGRFKTADRAVGE